MTYALIDCNNFFASCERIFRPEINKKPIIVLSNNDGCVVSRSNEAKALGIKMCAPYFKNTDLVKKHDVQVFSSNYKLYADISNRIMSLLSSLGHDIEIYSIDEAFLKIDDLFYKELDTYFINVRNLIFKNIGIPVSIGIAPNKVLAKIASRIAKNNRSGVFDLRCNLRKNEVLKTIDVEKIWGISKNIGFKLRNIGINSAYDLKTSNPKMIKKYLSVVVERIVLELNGQVCLDLEEVVSKKSITSSRTFAKPLRNLNDIGEALSNFVVIACEKLRSQNSLAQGISVYLYTNRFKENYYAPNINLCIKASNDTGELIRIAKKLLKNIFKNGYEYKKVGVLLFNLISSSELQNDLFTKVNTANERLMFLIDNINKVNKGSVFYAAQGTQNTWSPKSSSKSPEYTTNWNELAVVK